MSRHHRRAQWSRAAAGAAMGAAMVFAACDLEDVHLVPGAVRTTPPFDGGADVTLPADATTDPGDAGFLDVVEPASRCYHPAARRPFAPHVLVQRVAELALYEETSERTRWGILSEALGRFAAAPDNSGLYVGLSFFGRTSTEVVLPSATTCADVDYATADVPIELLPGNAQAIEMSLAENEVTPFLTWQIFLNENSTELALAGVVWTVAEFALRTPDVEAATLLVTTTAPMSSSCGASSEAAASAAAGNFMAGLPTYVLGLGPQTPDVDALAEAGGTSPASYAAVDSIEEIGGALSTILGRALPCSFALSSIAISYDAADVEVVLRSATGPDRVATRILDGANCGDAEAFYFDDPSNPRFATLCPSTCDSVRASGNVIVDFSTSCSVVTR